jgi:hypothetical protein
MWFSANAVAVRTTTTATTKIGKRNLTTFILAPPFFE